MRSRIFFTFGVVVTTFLFSVGPSFGHQNVLLIIADDLGVDVLDIDHATNTVQVTTEVDRKGTQQVFDLPNLSTLLTNGVYFTNTWATPICSPTRATIYTGLQPWGTGVGWAVDNYRLEDKLPNGTDLKTIANAICDDTETRTCGLFGKWHLGGEDYEEGNPNHNFHYTPLNRGWDYYAGNLGSHLTGGDTAYSSWKKFTPNDDNSGYHVKEDFSSYATKDVVGGAKRWIAAQTGTWFATLAFNAPHSPFHVPPGETYDPATTTDPDTTMENEFDKKGRYNAMDQSLDYYIGKLWDSTYGSNINDKLSNTLIIFLGDNGTPREVANVTRAKKTIYLGGIHVPLIIAEGAKVVDPNAPPTYLALNVIGETQNNQVNVADLYRTIISRTGASVSPGFGSHSFNLSGYLQGRTPSPYRTYNFTQRFKANGEAHATISNGTFKLNYKSNSTPSWELFDIVTDPDELSDLYDKALLTAEQDELMREIEKRQRTPTDSTW